MFRVFVLGAAVLALSIGGKTVYGGGWAVVTVTDLPETVMAGQPLRLTYAVRQHGVSLLGDLTGTLEARSGRHVVSATAVAATEPGFYAVSVTLPEPGQWTLTIRSGFWGKGDSAPLPITVVRGSPALTSSSDAERGERLFASKGCVTCHVTGWITPTAEAVGPTLRAKRLQSEYIRNVLANPATLRGSGPRGTFGMPDLRLRHHEIEALIAFLNRDGARLSGRRE
jgi:mono/diheme cytochrome c family protein